MYRKFAIICFLVLSIFSGCKRKMPAGEELAPERLLSFSPSGRQIVYFSESKENGEQFGATPGWYVLHDMDTNENTPLLEGSGWYRENVVWLENGGVAVEVDEGVVIKNPDEKRWKTFETELGLWYAVRPNGEVLMVEDGEMQKLFLMDPKTEKKKNVHIEWGKAPKKLTKIVWAETGEKFASIGDDDLVLVVIVLEKGGDVFGGGSRLAHFAFEDGLYPFYETDAPCKLSWGNGGTRIKIPCQKEWEASFDILTGELVRKEFSDEEENQFPKGSLIAPDNVRVAVIENKKIVVKHKSEFETEF